jgi:hypothetical protein
MSSDAILSALHALVSEPGAEGGRMQSPASPGGFMVQSRRPIGSLMVDVEGLGRLQSASAMPMPVPWPSCASLPAWARAIGR